jgi:hypothetical protein
MADQHGQANDSSPAAQPDGEANGMPAAPQTNVVKTNLFTAMKDKGNRFALKPLTRASIAMAIVPLGQ